MPVEKYTVRRGAFLHQKAKGTGPDIGEALVESIKAASPHGRVEKWKGHAERLGVGLDYLREAETLIDDHGDVEEIDRFDRCMAGAQADIEAAQNEITFIPLAVDRARQLHAPKKKKNKALLVFCRDLMQQKTSPSAAHLWKRIPLKNNPVQRNGITLYRHDEGEGEKIYLVLRTGKQATVGERAFADYFKEVKNFER
jgi:hypothetical protein